MPSKSEVGYAKNVANLQLVTAYMLYNLPFESLTVLSLTALCATTSTKQSGVEEKRNTQKNTIAVHQDTFASLIK